MEKVSIHDNLVIGYNVLCDEQKIVLHTEYTHGNKHEKTNVVFSRVEAYFFYRDNMKSILFDIQECDVEQVLTCFVDEFDAGIKYCWPGSWNESFEASREYLKQQQSRTWIIKSSYGMGGFVVAANMELEKVK
ncbi:MAG: hypothetical protein ACYSSP_00625 [Planctomycetota bacterium]